MTDQINDTSTDEVIHYCAKHPDRDTELRCNRCNRYMCIDCAVRTPVGYTCVDCVRGHEDKFYNSTIVDYAIVGVISVIGGAAGAFIVVMLGLFFTLIVAPVSGGVISQLALAVTGRRRGRQSGYVCGGGVFIGGLLTGLLFTGFGISTLLFLALAVPAAYAGYKVSI